MCAIRQPCSRLESRQFLWERGSSCWSQFNLPCRVAPCGGMALRNTAHFVRVHLQRTNEWDLCLVLHPQHPAMYESPRVRSHVYFCVMFAFSRTGAQTITRTRASSRSMVPYIPTLISLVKSNTYVVAGTDTSTTKLSAKRYHNENG